MCADPTGGYDASGNTIASPGLLTQDAGARSIMSLFPAANVNPSNNSGYNFYETVGGQQNVYIYRVRVDYNLNEQNKFYAAYQQAHTESPVPCKDVEQHHKRRRALSWRRDDFACYHQGI